MCAAWFLRNAFFVLLFVYSGDLFTPRTVTWCMAPVLFVTQAEPQRFRRKGDRQKQESPCWRPGTLLSPLNAYSRTARGPPPTQRPARTLFTPAPVQTTLHHRPRRIMCVGGIARWPLTAVNRTGRSLAKSSLVLFLASSQPSASQGNLLTHPKKACLESHCSSYWTWPPWDAPSTMTPRTPLRT